MFVPTPEISETQQSEFNGAILQTQRMHALQDKINFCNLNPLVFDASLNAYNYEILFSCMRSLFKECRPKLNDKDREQGDKESLAIIYFMKTYPVKKKVTNVRGGKESVVINFSVWNTLEKALEDFEKNVREYLNKTNYNSPSVDDGDIF